MHNLDGRVSLLPPAPYLEPLRTGNAAQAIEVVVANPPYIETRQLDQLQPEIRFFEPRAALDGGPDGLDCYRRLLPQCRALPRLQLIALEVGQGQAAAVADMTRQQLPSAQIEMVRDLAGARRVVMARI